MLYEFECGTCGLSKEVYRNHEKSGEPVTCDLCDGVMDRVYTVPNVSVFHSYYNHGLGIKVNRKQDIQDAIKKEKDQTGRELIEVGNDKQKISKKKQSYELTRDEYNKVRAMLGEHV